MSHTDARHGRYADRLAFAGMALVTGILMARLPGTVSWSGHLCGWLCVIAVLLLAWRKWLVLICFMSALVGFISMLTAWDHRLPPGLARQPVVLTGRIERVVVGEQGRRFITLKVASCRPLQLALPSCDRLRRVRLGWFAAAPVAAGERWQFSARMIPAHSRMNAGGGRVAAARMRAQALGATGSVQESPAPRRLAAARFSVRNAIAARYDHFLAESSAMPWAHALLLGDASLFRDSDWQRLNDSGTVHLAVVSGMHVGMLLACVTWLLRQLTRMLRPRDWRVQRWPWLLALCLAGAYVLVAGAGPPAVRAWLMAAVTVWYVSGHHGVPPFSGWWLALSALLLGEPLLIMRPGLWFSFIAVAALLLAWRWRPVPTRWVGLLRTQLTLGLLLDGAVLLVFGRWPPVSLLANVVAIPWVASVMLPLGLIALVASLLPGQPAAVYAWQLFEWATLAFDGWLALLTAWWPAITLSGSQRLAVASAMMLSALLWLLPGFSCRFRLALMLGLLPLLLVNDQQYPRHGGDLTIRAEDIGQGLLLDIRTRRHRMLYDTGPRSLSGYAPLRELWPAGQHFDMLMLSHADLDHAGGVAALHALHWVAQWRAPQLATLGLPASLTARLEFVACRAGQRWQWDGVIFKVLWPLPGVALPDDENSRSCVLLIEAQRQRVLITGDAPKAVEYRLLAAITQPLALLLSGHHGSAFSSSHSLLVRARPRHVIHSAGFFNPYRHPADAVVRHTERYAGCQWVTALDGTLTVRVFRGGVRVTPLRRQRAVERGCVEVSSARCHGVIHHCAASRQF